MKMPFGQYKGEDLRNVPFEYLYWLKQQDWVFHSLKDAASKVIGNWTPPKRRVETEYQRKLRQVEERNSGLNHPLENMLFDIGEKHGFYDDIFNDMTGHYEDEDWW